MFFILFHSVASLCHGACVEVESDTEAEVTKGFKLGCISCKRRGEVNAQATVDWYFMASDETEFSPVSSNKIYDKASFEKGVKLKRIV